MTKPKELFFFSHLNKPDHRHHTSTELADYLSYFQETRGRREFKNRRAMELFGCPYEPRCRGEATASYAAMDAELIEEALLLQPGLRVVMLLRNPVGRAWSSARRAFGRELVNLASEEIIGYLGDSYERACGDYPAMVEKWSSRLRPGHLYLAPFEMVRNQPEQLLKEAAEHLGVDPDIRSWPSLAREKLNQERVVEIRPELLEFLQETFQEVENWRQDYFKERFRSLKTG